MDTNNEIENTINNEQTTITQPQIMTIVDETPAMTYELPLNDINRENTALEPRDHTIMDFLSREILIGDFSFLSSQVRNEIIFSFDLPTLLINKIMVAEKLSAFKYISGNIEIKLVLNSMPFQAGILRLGIFPIKSFDDGFNSQLESLMQFTGLQGVDVNLQTNKSIKVVVPYIFPLPMWDLIDRPLDWATVQLRVYSPLISGTNTDKVSITVFARFVKETIKLSMPTSAVNATVAETMSNYYFDKLAEINYSKRTLQANLKAEKKQASKAGGPISTVANAVGTIATVASGIPGLGAIAGVVGTVSNVVGGIASMFGFSKPLSEQIPTHIRVGYTKGMNNSDFVDPGHNMALCSTNSLDVASKAFMTDIDEMSFASIIRIPHYIADFSFKTSNNVNDLLFSYDVSPQAGIQFENNVAYVTSLCYIASCFHYWRGDTNFTFKLAKTKFHSGRLMIVWFNQTQLIPSAYSSLLAENPSLMIDINDENFEFDFCVEYLQAQPWLLNSDFYPNEGNRASQNNGRIGVYVITELQVAGAAATSIDIIVEMRAGENMQFSVPRAPVCSFGNLMAAATVIDDVIVDVLYTEVTAIEGSGYAPLSAVKLQAGTFMDSYFNSGTTTVLFKQENLQFLEAGTTWISFDELRFTFTPTIGTLDAELAFAYYNAGVLIFTKTFTLTAIPPPTITLNKWRQHIVPSNRTLQIGRDEAFLGKNGIPILSSSNTSNPPNVNVQTVGETVASVRELCHRYCPIQNYVLRRHSVTGRTFLLIQNYQFLTLANGLSFQPYFNYFYPAYRMWKGGVRYKLFVEYGNSMWRQMVKMVYVPSALIGPSSDANIEFYQKMIETSNHSQILTNTILETVIEYSVPYYNKNPLSIVGNNSNWEPLNFTPSYMIIDLGIHSEEEFPTIKVNLYQALADDFALGSYLSTPTMKVTT